MKPTVAIVQARMGSSRLPGKVLLELAGRPVLARVHERLARVPRIDTIVIATTDDPADRPIVRFCERAGIDVYAHDGPQDDLLGRYIACGRRYDADIIVMVDGDCPLLHPPTVERMVAALQADPTAEYCRLDPRSIEGGVAVLRLATFERMRALASEPAHREHATLFLMEHPEMFSLVEVPCDDELRDIKHRLWLDTPADYRFLSRVHERLGAGGAIPDLHDVVRLIRAEPDLAALNAHVTQKDVRATGRPLNVAAPGLADPEHESVWRVAMSLVERFNAGITVSAAGLTPAQQARWADSGVPVAACAGPDILFDSALDGVEPRTPSPQGHARLAVGPSDDTEETAAMIAAYFGLRRSDRGHFEPTLRSSRDGSHLEERACPLCGSARKEVIWSHPSGVQNGVCPECGHVHLVRTLPAETIDASYRAFGQSLPEAALCAEDGDVARLARARGALVRARVAATPRSALEIGSGYGHFLAGLESTAMRVGIEPSQVQAGFARRHFGLGEIWACTYEALERRPVTWPTQGFDVVCSYHVLEHVRDPLAMLDFARRMIAPSGALFLAVPNLLTLSPDLIELHFLARCWHLHTFTPEALGRLLAGSGFEIVEAVDEEPIAMLRSSLFVHARPAAVRPLAPANVEEIENARALAVAFHTELGTRLARVRSAFRRWREAGRRVVIYGGGIHTAALLDLTPIDREAIACIVDDDPDKQGTEFEGVPVVSLSDALGRGVDVVVASSLAAEEAILARLGTILPPAVEAVGVYRDLMETSEGSQI